MMFFEEWMYLDILSVGMIIIIALCNVFGQIFLINAFAINKTNPLTGKIKKIV